MNNLNINIKKLTEQIASIDTISKEKNWSFYYDMEMDSLYFSPNKINKKYSLYSLTNEFSVYIDKESNFGGIFIEYYKSNMTSHDQKFKKFREIFTKKIDENYRTTPKKEEDNVILLSEVLKAELLSELIKSKTNNIVIPG